MKWCNSCKVEKLQSEFGKNRLGKDGLYFQCKSCRAKVTAKWRRDHGAEIRAKKKPDNWHILYPEKKTNVRLKTVYGITLDDYKRMHKNQKGKCAICEESETMTFKGKLKDLCVDHCHESGLIRGLLCSRCNSAIGLFKHRPARMQRALTYVFVGGFDGLAESL